MDKKLFGSIIISLILWPFNSKSEDLNRSISNHYSPKNG